MDEGITLCRLVLEATSAAVWEYDAAADRFTLRIAGKAEGILETVAFPSFSESIRSDALVHAEDVELTLSVLRGEWKQDVRIRCDFFGAGMGWVLLSRCRRREETRRMGALRDITAEKKQESELLHQASHDGLTRLLNQCASQDAVQACLDRGWTGTLFLLDLDRFKEINDTRGHLYGNQVLIRFAHALTRTASPGDVLGRVGGDEFILFINGCGRAEAVRSADSLLRRLAEAATPCSAGVATVRPGDVYDALFARADRALYEAKRNGRSNWVFAENQK